jgi:hypothetical protein
MTAQEGRVDAGQFIGLTHVFTPAQAAAVLRSIGLEDITECALRTRAYRRQIPFHLNGHRIIFTIDDLGEIAEGKVCRPQADEVTDPPGRLAPAARPASASASRRKPARASHQEHEAWRARRPRNA